MKKQITRIVLMLLCVLLLSGCACSHEWTEADCLTPKTCSKCQETEGEALGHQWADATCSAAKTCAVCNLTEGDPLPHTLTEATFQDAPTCTVCGTVEGEPLTASFVENGFQVDVTECGVPCNLTANGTSFAFTVDSYKIYPSDETHEALEGYEWRTVAFSVEALENVSSLGHNIPVYPDYDNYYDTETFNATLEQVESSALLTLKHTGNHHGKDYPEMLFQLDDSYLDTAGGKWIYRQTVSCRVPVGYDGIVISVGDAAMMNGEYQELYKDFYLNENTVIFRMT
jgi:hypothetical protein